MLNDSFLIKAFFHTYATIHLDSNIDRNSFAISVYKIHFFPHSICIRTQTEELKKRALRLHLKKESAEVNMSGRLGWGRGIYHSHTANDGAE